MSEHQAEDDRIKHEAEFLEAQEHKGYGDDEGERAELLEDEPDDEHQGD
jgi:hypothetical protein